VGTDLGSAVTDSTGLATDFPPDTSPGVSSRLTQAPGSYTATASCSVAQCGVLLTITTNPFTINQEDAQFTYTGLQYFTTTATATTVNVTVSYTLQDATALDPSNPIYDLYPGDITKAKVMVGVTTVAGTNFSGGCGPLTVAPVAGYVGSTGLPSTGTVTCVINNVPVNGSYNLAATAGTGSYYTLIGDTPMSITTANGGVGFITGGGFQTAAYLATSNTSAGKYTTAGLLKPATNTKMNFGFETKYNKSGSNLQGGANIIVRSACVNGITGYTPFPGDDGLCVYQIKSNSLTSLTEILTPTPANAAFTAKATIQDVTRPTALAVAGNLTLQLNMYDVADPGANADTLSIQVTDSVNGLWISNNWTGVKTVISSTAPVINGGNLQVH
jgi:hypothetical protein